MWGKKHISPYSLVIKRVSVKTTPFRVSTFCQTRQNVFKLGQLWSFPSHILQSYAKEPLDLTQKCCKNKFWSLLTISCGITWMVTWRARARVGEFVLRVSSLVSLLSAAHFRLLIYQIKVFLSWVLLRKMRKFNWKKKSINPSK